MSTEQEMREAIIAADSIRRGEHEGWREFCDRRYEVIWQAATLAAEARIRDVCIKVADEIYTQIAISVTATKIPAIVDSVLDAALTEHKENQG